MTRAFIPSDVQEIIVGLDFSLSPFNYIPFKKTDTYGSLVNRFNFQLSNDLFDHVGLNSESTFYNTHSFFSFTLLMMPLLILTLILNKLLSKLLIRERWLCLTKVAKWILGKAYVFLTFSYFIRTFLEMTQYLMISSIYEIYTFNTSESLRIVSLAFAITVLYWCILINIFIFYLALSSHVINEEKHNKLGEFFDGLKTNK